MQKAIPNDYRSKKSRSVLNALYHSWGSWGEIARRLKVPKATVHAVATGERRCGEELWQAVRLQNPKTLKRLIKKIGIPFLQRAELMRGKSPRGIYGRGGVPL